MQKSGIENCALNHNHESEDCPWFPEDNHKYVDDMFRKKKSTLYMFFWPRVSDGLECRLIRRSNSPDVETRADGIFRFFFARETLYMYVLV